MAFSNRSALVSDFSKADMSLSVKLLVMCSAFIGRIVSPGCMCKSLFIVFLPLTYRLACLSDGSNQKTAKIVF